MTWAQLYQRTLNVAHELRRHGAVGDRAVILAPQGLAYIVAFLGAMQAGLIAVPLSVPAPGSHDERVSALLADTTPTVVLTTSAAAGTVTEYLGRPGPATAAAVVEIDALDLDDAGAPSIRISAPQTAYLQYTSGSTRLPAGVMISHRNLQANFQQLVADYFVEANGVPPRDTAVVSWLPFYHDMGFVLGVIAPILGGYRGDLTSPVAFLQRPARWIHAMANGGPVMSAAPNFAFELAVRKTSDADLEEVDLGNVLGVISGAERIHPTTLDRGAAERCAAEAGSPLLSYGMPRSPRVRIVNPDTCRECPPGSVGEICVHGDNVAGGYWQKPEETERTFAGIVADPSPGTPGGPGRGDLRRG